MAQLKIEIDIADEENTILAPTDIGATGEHNIKEIKAKGTLLVKNETQKSRLWNLSCDLKEIVNTNLSKDLNIGAINPGQEYKNDYEIQNPQEPCLKVVETFDTEVANSGVINNTFLYENANKCALKLDLTNTLDVPFTEITVVKELPEYFQEIEIKSPSIGSAEQGEAEGKRVLNWKIQGLGAKETAKIEVNCTVVPKEREDKSIGKLKLNYLINNNKLTRIDPVIRGETDSMSGVTRDEGSNPGTWDCNVEFMNDSELQVKLEQVSVTHKIPTGVETVVSETPNQALDSDATWDKNFPIESPNVPELASEIVFTPLYNVTARVIGEITKEPTYYHVLSAEVHKAINPPEVDAYANTNMTIVNTIPNKGTSVFDTLVITDEIPSDFIAPLMKEIKIEVKNSEGVIEIQERKEFVDNIAISPDDQDPDSKHIITIKLKDLQKQVTPGSNMVISYPILAKNPAPEVKYNTPVEIKANVPVKGSDFVISPPEEPVIKIKYVARKLKTLKSIKPGLSEGEFSISVRIQNKGDVELENLVMKDKIAAGFTLTEFTPPEGTTHKVNQEGELEVKIVELRGGDTLNINYNCSGSGDYPRTEPTINVLGREGVESSATGSSGPSEDATVVPKATVTDSKSIVVSEIFQEIKKKLDQGITGIQLGEILEGKRDTMPPGPVLHQIMLYAKDLKKQAKIIVGSLRDEVDAKINGFKEKYL